MLPTSRLLVIALASGPAFAAVPGERPGDAKLTCAQIGAELQPAAQQMMAGMGDMGAVLAPLQKRAVEKQAEFKQRSAMAAGCFAANVAASMATAGLAGDAACAAADKAYEMRDKALEPQRQAEDKRTLDGLERGMAGANATAATLDRPRIDRLMALAEAKQCN